MRTSLRLTAAAACVVGLAATAPAAMADSRFDVYFDNSAGAGSAGIVDNNDFSGNHQFQANLVRGGSVIASDNEDSPFLFVDVPNGGRLLAGDTIQYLIDGNITKTQSYDGTPTVNGPLCVGDRSFTGSEDDGSALQVFVFAPGSGSASRRKDLSVTRGSGAYTATLTSEALGSRDFVEVEQDFTSGDTSVAQFVDTTPTTCSSPSSTPGATTNTTTNNNTTSNPAPASNASTSTPAKPTLVQIIAALKSLAAQDGVKLNALDLAKFLSGGGAGLPVSFLVPGTFRALLLSGGASGRSASIAKSAKAITVASGSATSSAPGAATLKLKLSKAGRKLLRHRSSAHLTLQIVFTPADGTAAQTSSAKVTLKKHKKAKKTKKSKKAAKRG